MFSKRNESERDEKKKKTWSLHLKAIDTCYRLIINISWHINPNGKNKQIWILGQKDQPTNSWYNEKKIFTSQ